MKYRSAKEQLPSFLSRAHDIRIHIFESSPSSLFLFTVLFYNPISRFLLLPPSFPLIETIRLEQTYVDSISMVNTIRRLELRILSLSIPFYIPRRSKVKSEYISKSEAKG